jgi:hypothetical protein
MRIAVSPVIVYPARARTPPPIRYSITMPTHPMARVRFESVACLNPLLDESLLVVCENA